MLRLILLLAAAVFAEAGENGDRHLFEVRFDRLIDSLVSLSNEYYRLGEREWPQREVLEVERAYRLLERSPLWGGRGEGPGDGEAAAEDVERRLLARRFNRLIDSLRQFKERYCEGRGQVWPLRELEQVRRAFRELEQTQGWRCMECVGERHTARR